MLDLPWEGTDPDHWRAAAEAEGRIVLAGKLGPDNVRAAIAAVQPWAVDAASSLESRAGNQGSRQGEAIRGGSPLMTTDTTRRPTAPTAAATCPRR